MERTFGNIQVNRRDSVREELLNNYYSSNNIVENDQNIEQPLNNFEVQNPYENLAIAEFNSNIEIYKNGEKVTNNEYKDYNSELSPYHHKNQENKQNPYHQTTRQPVRPTNEPVQQVDPASFFGSSLKGII